MRQPESNRSQKRINIVIRFRQVGNRWRLRQTGIDNIKGISVEYHCAINDYRKVSKWFGVKDGIVDLNRLRQAWTYVCERYEADKKEFELKPQKEAAELEKLRDEISLMDVNILSLRAAREIHTIYLNSKLRRDQEEEDEEGTELD